MKKNSWTNFIMKEYLNFNNYSRFSVCVTRVTRHAHARYYSFCWIRINMGLSILLTAAMKGSLTSAILLDPGVFDLTTQKEFTRYEVWWTLGQQHPLLAMFRWNLSHNVGNTFNCLNGELQNINNNVIPNKWNGKYCTPVSIYRYILA